MTTRYVLAFICALFVVSGFSQEWKPIKEEDNIQVFTRKSEAQSIKEVKVIGKVQATLHEVVAALEDFDYHEEWVFKTIDSRIIEHVSVGKLYYYISSAFPFPAKNRDLVVFYERTQDPNTKVVFTKATAAPAKELINDKFIRIEEFVGTYQIKPNANGWINVEYLLKTDPGGSLPKWIINLAIVDGPLKTMNGLFRLIKTGKYKDHKVEGISEF